MSDRPPMTEDDVLRRMLATKPTPHKEKGASKPAPSPSPKTARKAH